VEVAAPAPAPGRAGPVSAPPPRRGRGPAGWTLAALGVALLVAGPLLVLPASFVGRGEAFDQIAASLLPEALRASLVLALGVGAGTLALGGSLAALVSFWDFPGRRWIDWALVLPMAVPAYVLVFVLLGQYDASSTVGRLLPDVRTWASRARGWTPHARWGSPTARRFAGWRSRSPGRRWPPGWPWRSWRRWRTSARSTCSATAR
jgi:ABC-type sugar transport system permease subunit